MIKVTPLATDMIKQLVGKYII